MIYGCAIIGTLLSLAIVRTILESASVYGILFFSNIVGNILEVHDTIESWLDYILNNVALFEGLAAINRDGFRTLNRYI